MFELCASQLSPNVTINYLSKVNLDLLAHDAWKKLTNILPKGVLMVGAK